MALWITNFIHHILIMSENYIETRFHLSELETECYGLLSVAGWLEIYFMVDMDISWEMHFMYWPHHG